MEDLYRHCNINDVIQYFTTYIVSFKLEISPKTVKVVRKKITIGILEVKGCFGDGIWNGGKVIESTDLTRKIIAGRHANICEHFLI